MKHLCLLLLLMSVKVFAQSEQVIRIDSFPKAGIVLNEGWKWNAGDNPEWAKEGYDDSGWESIDPTQDIDNLPAVKKAGRGWLRLKLRVDSSLRNKIVGIMVNQMIASEIYLEGRQVAKFGVISPDAAKIRAYNPSGAPLAASEIVHFQLGEELEQVLTIKFALQPNILYLKFLILTNPLFKVKINEADRLNKNSIDYRGYIETTFLDYLKIGIFFILFLLHFLFYFRYRLQASNFYFGVYCIFVILILLLQIFIFQVFHYISTRMLLLLFEHTFYYFAPILLVKSIYRLLAIKNTPSYYLLITYALFNYLLVLKSYQFAAALGMFYIVIFNLEIVRVSIRANKRKIAGAKMIMYGGTVFMVMIAVFFTYTFFLPNTFFNLIIRHLTYNLGVLSAPVSFTFYYANEFARTSYSLTLKLKEVEALTAHTIAQEQEKQRILATQNETLEHQVAERTAQLQASQAQLIQREKLASLGELTAGIAHEIQNPLNFVNNFAEVSAEMALEMKEEMDKGETEEAKFIADDLILNLQKINHHGKRASSIVKNMLEHSRTSTGEKASTQLNTLLDECLRLSYHGMRAQEKDFQAEYSLDLEADLPEVVVVAQDIGRVLLNLFNNAFYAVQQKRKQLPAEFAYTPLVSASTRKTEQGIEIRISDNGDGIPEAIRDKIFQPFFTTKPTGEGTGLGLSLAYDIITKGHGGNISVESVEGESTTFHIIIP